ncbi:YcxB family protein [Streptomyces sp. NPDC005526]|uniref:YcxB family protein n=1 Tax=Streptomyces sp. NPDC005526 TaxID=3156885 RepID=UPI0033B5973B
MVMDMNMGRDAARDGVELVYQPTVEDYASALRARRRASRAGGMQRWLPGGLLVCAGLQAALMIAGGDGSVTFIVYALVAAVLVWLTPWLQARQVHKLSQRQGTFRVTVTETGLALSTDNTTASVNWVAQPRYAETREVFVLLSADKNAVGFTMLPKRGLTDPAEADRLREILDRNLTRV